eukprot:TRINITY_DN64088_c0_g1_i1.p1 TRINITY_DN64088_c0_g1~~TRINITY_DN64088_c0_g1_i1.p1  ORF type:complete len:885 (-),score=136.35 TRINITY_DN64088_c0_g1_i1:14-2668(-)
MAVPVNRLINIHNFYLELLYWMMLIGIAGFACYELIVKRGYTVEIPITDQIDLEMWAEFNSEETDLQSLPHPSHCVNASRYDYWWDSSDRYESHTCLEMCEEEAEEEPGLQECMRPLDTYFEQKSLKEILIVTSIQDELLTEGQWMPRKRFFAPFPDLTTVHVYAMFNLPRYDLFRSQLLFDQSAWLDMRTNVRTVLLDPTSKPIRTVQPSMSGLQLTVDDLLLMTGSSTEFLDRPWTETNAPNAKPGEANEPFALGPAPRVVGLQIHVKLHCTNDDGPGSMLNSAQICFITARRNDAAWPYLDKEFLWNKNESLYRTFYGVSVQVEVTGAWRVVSFGAMLQVLVEIMVLLSIPATIIRILCKYSPLYRDAVLESYRVEDKMFNLALGLLRGRTIFRSMQSEENHSSDGDRVSEDYIQSQLKEIILHLADEQELPPDGVDCYVKYCYHLFAKHAKHGSIKDEPNSNGVTAVIARQMSLDSFIETGQNEARSLFSSGSRSTQSDPKAIGLDAFCKASDLRQLSNLKKFLHLFTEVKWRWPWEYLLTPPKIRHFMAEHREKPEQSQTDQLEIEIQSQGQRDTLEIEKLRSETDPSEIEAQSPVPSEAEVGEELITTKLDYQVEIDLKAPGRARFSEDDEMLNTFTEAARQQLSQVLERLALDLRRDMHEALQKEQGEKHQVQARLESLQDELRDLRQGLATMGRENVGQQKIAAGMPESLTSDMKSLAAPLSAGDSFPDDAVQSELKGIISELGNLKAEVSSILDTRAAVERGKVGLLELKAEVSSLRAAQGRSEVLLEEMEKRHLQMANFMASQEARLTTKLEAKLEAEVLTSFENFPTTIQGSSSREGPSIRPSLAPAPLRQQVQLGLQQSSTRNSSTSRPVMR